MELWGRAAAQKTVQGAGKDKVGQTAQRVSGEAGKEGEMNYAQTGGHGVTILHVKGVLDSPDSHQFLQLLRSCNHGTAQAFDNGAHSFATSWITPDLSLRHRSASLFQ